VEVNEFVQLLLDARQPREVRADALRRLRGLHESPPDQMAAKDAMLSVACTDLDPQLRLQATASIGDFVHDAQVSAALGRIVADLGESLEQRYFALTSLERGGPTPSSMALLASVVGDEELGKTVAAILSRWQARLRREPGSR
jgi:hypothetical protein